MPVNTPSKSLAKTESLVYSFVFVVVVAGIALSFLDRPAFQAMIGEDGPVEWLTVAGLLLAMSVCLRRLAALYRDKPWPFLLTTALGALAFLFGAGEELSWGQRLIGFQTPDWLAARNVQGETNVHNLTVGGVELTQWLFGRGIAILLVVYFAVLTPLHVFRPAVAANIDRLGIPVPRARQVIVFAGVAAALHIPDIPGRESELFELAAVFLVLAILVNPRNREAFRAQGVTGAAA